MTTIDDKVVAMSFENSKFESGVRTTMGSIDKLKNSLKFPDAGKGLDKIGEAAGRLNLGRIANDVDSIKGKFGALSVAALAVFANIAIKAVSAGAQLAKSLSLDPIIAGFKEYSTNLNAIQTVLANTQASGATLSDVNKALLVLNKYSDKTIYNFGQMAKNIGTFTAAGVDLNTATASIKGIANLAALSGSSADQAATAMYQLSQAISSGRVSLQDWNSVVNAGIGGTVFQRALATTAERMGTLKKGSVQLVGPMKNVKIAGESFRESIGGPGPKWLTSDVLTKTLEQFTGDLTDAQLKAQGFDDAQIKAIQQTAKAAQHAATEVKTISQVFDVAKETAGSGWSQTFQIIFGNFDEAKKTFTSLSNAINGFINLNAQARNKVLADWKKLGGRTKLIEGIKTVFHNLGLILKPIKDAFRDIFPAKTGKDLLHLTTRFQELAAEMKPSPKTVDNLKRTFKGLFALLDIGKQIIGGLFGFFKDLFREVGGGKGSFLGLTATIGDFIVKVDKALKEGNGLHNFFAGLARVLAVPLNILKEVAHALASLFSGFSPGGFSVQMGGITKAMTPFQTTLKKVNDLWRRFLNSFNGADAVFQKAFDGFVKFAEGLGPAISNAISHMNFEAILEVVRTGLLVGLFLMFKKFLGKGAFSDQLIRIFGKSFGRIGGGILKNINLSLKSFSGTMQAMQTNLKAKTLKEIAIAIGILALSILALSFVDPKRLGPAMTAIAVMLGELLGALKLMDKFIAAGGAIKIPLVAGSLILLAGAIDLLTIAVFGLSRLSWDQLKKGLGGVTALLIGLTAASGPLGKNAPGLIRAGIGITAIAFGLNVMAVAVRQFGSMDLHQLAKGLGAVAASLVIVGLAVQTMPKTMILQGASLIAVATGLNIMFYAVKQFGSLDWKTIEKGLVGVGGALVAIAIGMKLMPLSLPVTALGLLLVSLALGKIVKAIGVMGKMSIRQLATGIISLAAALGVLAAGLALMSGTLGGSIALGVAAAGISVLVPALIALGKQSKKQIIKGLLALAGALALLGVAGLALAPVAPALLAVGAAMLLIGAGLALAGAGIALVGIGLSAIAVAGPAAVAVLLKAITDFTAAIPKMAVDFALGLLSIVDALAKVAPKFVDALVKIINSLLDVIIKASPKVAKAIEAILDLILKVFHDRQDKVIQAGIDLIIALLNGIRKNIGEVVRQAAAIIVNLLEGLRKHVGEIVTAGADFIVSFITGLASNFSKVVQAGVNAAGKILIGFAKGLVTLIDKGAQAIITFLNGVADVIDKREPEIIKAFARIGEAIVKGLIKGIGDLAPELRKKITDLIKSLPDKALKILHIRSPSGVFMEIGKNVVRGLAIGIDKDSVHVHRSIQDLGKSMVKSMEKINFDIDINLTITPVLDLSEVEKGSRKINGIVNRNPSVMANVTHGQALRFSHEATAHQIIDEPSLTSVAGTTTNYTQNNYSPKALSAVEIYRQTRNQLSRLKQEHDLNELSKLKNAHALA